jgi:hypothetical protein
MKKLLLLSIIVNCQLSIVNCIAQTVIARQDFEVVPSPPVWNYSDFQGTSTYLDSLNLSTESPPSTPYGVDTTRAWETNQQSAGVIIEFDNVDISAYSNVYITYRVAAFSVGSNTNGPDALDHVIPSVSVDGGATWYQRKRITGNSNNSWEYTATAIATDTFVTANTTFAYAPAGPGLRTTDGYSTAIIYIPNGYTQVKLRIDSRESTAQERWCIDNVEIRGDSSACSASISIVSPVLCNGDCNAAAAAMASGTSPFTYLWSPSGQTGQTATALCAGNYTVTVTDSLGCPATQAVSITEPSPLIIGIPLGASILCHGDSTGSITATASGGTAPYTYTWLPTGDTTAALNNVPAGNYTVTVTDSAGCSATQVVTITEPDSLTTTICAQTDLLCFGDSAGCLTVCADGGTPPYTYIWATSDTGNTICGLFPGLYSVTVFDANGCMAETFGILTQPLPITISVSVTDASCSSCCDGFIAVDSVVGGVGGYTYSWSPVSSTADSIGALCVGAYTICVTDLNGCSVCTSDTISFPSAVNTIYSAGNSVSVIPNPFTNEVTIVGAEGSDIILYDYTGKEILHITSTSTETVLNTEGIAAGIYLLRVASASTGSPTGGAVRNYKVVKQQ